MKKIIIGASSFSLMVALWVLLLDPQLSEAGGTWAALANPPPAGVNNSLLMSDGTVICGDGGQNWYRLTPDIHGSYVNGTWTQIASMNYTRLFYSSDVLTNGNVYVAGGEYGTGDGHAELYDSLANTWTVIPQPAVNYSDACSKLLPDGNVLQSDSQSGIYLYNTFSNLITADGGAADQNEACWVRMPNDNILTIEAYGQNTEHYVPSQNQWYADNIIPVPLFGFGGELGAGLVLPNGNVFYIGATTNTAIYSPGNSLTSAGSWTAGPGMVFGTNQLGAVDAPAAMMVNGKILCDLGPVSGLIGPCSFYEYDYALNTFTSVNAPGGGTNYGGAPFGNTFLDLPDGNVLFVGGQGSTSLYVYQPAGPPLAAGQPTISNLTENANGSYHLTGVGLNGITGGAAYGDDWQMDCNYPLVRMTNSSSGDVYYARTYQWSSTTIQNSNLVSTEFTLPANLPAGTYSLVVSAVGNASKPVTFTYAPPAVPTGLTASSGSNALVKLQWNASIGAMAYNVKRALSSGAYFAPLATISATNYTDAGLTNGLTYYYEVAAVGNGGPSTNSGSASATPFGPPPVPIGLTATGGADAIVPLTWNPSYGATSYNVKRSTIYGGPYTNIASLDATNYTDTGLTNGTNYYYVVTSVGAEGESSNSVPASATPLAPVVITWFKADAIAGLANGATIASWGDSSGNGYIATQNTSSQRPMYVVNAMNGLPVVRFNTVNSTCLTFNRPVQDNFTIFCVFRSTQGLGAGTLYYQGAGLVNGEVSGVVNDFGTCLFANGQVCAGTGNPDEAVDSATGFNDGNPHLMTFKRIESTGEIDLYVDGNLMGTTNGGLNSLTAPTKLALGEVQTGINFLSGDISEVKIYTSALSDVDRISQEAMLVHKWGVTLPANPTGLTAAAANGEVALNWIPYPTATNYLVQRSLASGGPYAVVGSTPGTNYVDATVVNGTTYYYVVSAVTAYTTSTNSAEASALPVAPALAAWFRADAITGLANGATVASWGDSSGNGFTATQSTSGKRPTYVVNAMNGLPVVRFNSTNGTYLSFNRPVQDDFTIIIVYRSSQTNQGTGTAFYQGAGLVNGDQPGTADDFGTSLNANGQVLAGTGNPDTSINSGSGFNDGKPHLVTFTRTESTGALGLYADGSLVATGTGSTSSLTAPPQLWLGAVPSGSGRLTGDIAEAMIFNTALSDTNRVIEETGLECKYGLAENNDVLATPSGLNGSWGNRQITLNWVGVSGAADYIPSSATNLNGPYNPLAAGVATNSFVDTNAMVGRTNYYEVTAVRGCSVGPASGPVGVFLPTTSLGISSLNNSSIAVSWPSWANDWALHYATNLTSPRPWLAVTNIPTSSNGQFIVTLPIGSGAGFFQLVAP